MATVAAEARTPTLLVLSIGGTSPSSAVNGSSPAVASSASLPLMAGRLQRTLYQEWHYQQNQYGGCLGPKDRDCQVPHQTPTRDADGLAHANKHESRTPDGLAAIPVCQNQAGEARDDT
ncbi:MAG: hypothetical protein ACOYEV_12465 [Candidatus Nanopelagicales bacterium]